MKLSDIIEVVYLVRKIVVMNVSGVLSVRFVCSVLCFVDRICGDMSVMGISSRLLIVGFV